MGYTGDFLRLMLYLKQVGRWAVFLRVMLYLKRRESLTVEIAYLDAT